MNIMIITIGFRGGFIVIQVLLIAIAICIDSFLFGITYGIKQIQIPKLSILIIDLVSICVLGTSILFGHIIRQFISEGTASLISCITLISLGSFFMFEGYIKYKMENSKDNKIAKLRIPRLGLIIDIALDVTKGDLDISGDINVKEALYLGFVLSIDAFGAGFGISVGGAAYFYLLLFIFCFNILSILYGMHLGRKINSYKRSLKTSLLPGGILIFVALLRFL